MTLRSHTSMPTLWTIGHSTHSGEDFLALLTAHGISRIVDVRRFPGSRRYPHFGSDALGKSLTDAKVGYQHMPTLGGRRTAQPDSRNDGWKNAGFRGYADYMQTEEFQRAIDELRADATQARTAIMCAEGCALALPSLIDRRRSRDAGMGSRAYYEHGSGTGSSRHSLCRPAG